MPDPLPTWDARSAVGTKRAARLNAMSDGIRPWLNVTGDVTATRFPGGVALNVKSGGRGIDVRPGIVSDAPDGEDDAEPPYVWAKYARPQPGGIDDDIELEEAPPPADTEAGEGKYTQPYPVKARVLGPPGVSAPIGTEGLLIQTWDLGTEDMPSRPHWLFVCGGAAVRVRLKSFDAGGPGCYGGRSIGPRTATGDITAGALVLDDFGTEADADDCLVVNRTELGRENNAHLLILETEWDGQVVHTNTDGKKIVVINAGPIPSETFVAFLTMDGGSDGGPTTTASWTYTVVAENGETLGTGASVVARTNGNGKATAATTGLAAYDEGGTLGLIVAFEAPGTNPCVP